MLWGEQTHLDGLGEQDRIEPAAGLDVWAETSSQTPTLDPVDLSFLENSKAARKSSKIYAMIWKPQQIQNLGVNASRSAPRAPSQQTSAETT